MGLGSMGGRLAERVVLAGYDTAVFDVSPGPARADRLAQLSSSATREFASRVGSRAADSPADCVAGRTVLLTCLPRSINVRVIHLLPGSTAGECRRRSRRWPPRARCTRAVSGWTAPPVGQRTEPGADVRPRRLPG